MENENKTIAGKQIITIVLKADAWESTDKESIMKQRVYNIFVTDENAQVYFGSEKADILFADDKDKKTDARAMFDRLTRLTTWSGYIEVYINSSDIPEMKDFPITLIQDRNESKINSNLEKQKAKEKTDD